MRTVRVVAPLPALALLAACGGGPTAPPPVPTHAVTITVFYDQNANALLDGDEVTRLGSVTVEAGGASATTVRLTGQGTLGAVPDGMQTFRARADSLPPYFQGRDVMASVPVSGELRLPAVLPIGSNVPATYLALGDSITVGDGSSDEQGYEPLLEDRLRAEWGQATVINDGVDGNKSFQGADRIAGDLARFRPACVLILLGTNDWNHCDDVDSCFTQDSVRSMLRASAAADTRPFLSTIIPANTGDPSGKAPPSRNEWNEAMNARLKAIAAEEGAVVVDLYAAFTRAAGGDLSQLFADHVHPNDRGHEIIAGEYFRVITSPRSTTTASLEIDPARLFSNPPGGLLFGFPDEGAAPTTPPGLPTLLLAPPLSARLH